MKLLPFTLTLLLTFLFFGCNSDKETLQVETNITSSSGEKVDLQASGAQAYSWRQLSGTSVILVGANSATPSFIAPDVAMQETLVFELEAVTAQIQEKNLTLKKQVHITVHPKLSVEDSTDTGSTPLEMEPEQQEEAEEENDVAESTDTLPAPQEEVTEASDTDMNSTSGEVEAEQVAEVVNSSSKEVELEEQSNETNTTTNETNTTAETNTTQPTVSLKSLKLTLEKNSLNVDTNTTLKVVATYSDNSTKDVTNEVEWIYTDKLAIDIKNNILKTFHKDTNIFIQASLQNITSNAVALEIYKEINGHRLPPEPDPIVNNSTLLGIDTNDNGVRDDVERWVYQEYDEPIVQAVAMQNARAFQIILVDPSKARETTKFMEARLDCQSYYMYQDERKLIPRGTSLHKESRPLMLNTRERNRAYYEYNQALSGGVYPARDRSKYKESCDFNESKVIDGEWE
ncbi:MAG: hypothetical protein J7J31_07725 [Helicobacteraceae bacterium]|nr:hypothetical protein [Helicobacteraceae bacterium]